MVTTRKKHSHLGSTACPSPGLKDMVHNRCPLLHKALHLEPQVVLLSAFYQFNLIPFVITAIGSQEPQQLLWGLLDQIVEMCLNGAATVQKPSPLLRCSSTSTGHRFKWCNHYYKTAHGLPVFNLHIRFMIKLIPQTYLAKQIWRLREMDSLMNGI